MRFEVHTIKYHEHFWLPSNIFDCLPEDKTRSLP